MVSVSLSSANNFLVIFDNLTLVGLVCVFLDLILAFFSSTEIDSALASSRRASSISILSKSSTDRSSRTLYFLTSGLFGVSVSFGSVSIGSGSLGSGSLGLFGSVSSESEENSRSSSRKSKSDIEIDNLQ